jgi:hypothetical protein
MSRRAKHARVLPTSDELRPICALVGRMLDPQTRWDEVSLKCEVYGEVDRPKSLTSAYVSCLTSNWTCRGEFASLLLHENDHEQYARLGSDTHAP